MDLGNQDLAVLIGYKLMKNWDARICFVAALEDEERGEAAKHFLHTFASLARIPQAECALQSGGPEGETRIEVGDLNIIPMAARPDFATLRRISEKLGTPCLFTIDSGEENVLA